MPKQLVRNPLLLLAVAVAVLLGLLITFAYLGAFLDPQRNAENVPVAVVSQDAGATLRGTSVDVGAALTQAVTAGTLADTAVRYTVLPSRDAAIARMQEDKEFAAIVLGHDFSARVVRRARTGAGAPAEIEIVTNPAAGTLARSFAQEAATRTAERFGRSVVAGVSAALRQVGATPPKGLTDAIAVKTTVGVPVSQKSAEGTGPFFFELTVALGGFFLAAIVAFGVELACGRQRLELLGRSFQGGVVELSRAGATIWKVVLTLVLAALTAGLQTALAVKALGMDATDPVKLALFSALGSAAIGIVTLFFLLALDVAGRVVAVLVTLLFGVPTSGGVYPEHVLPGFFRFLGEWLPLRRMTDGARSLVFFDGRMSAGLATAIWVLLGYLLGFTALTLLSGWRARPRELPAES